MVYFVMALALFAEEDYEEVAARLTQTLRGWGCWDDGWEVPTSGGITQARQRLGPEPVAEVFGQVAVPVADLDTAGAFLGPWRLMAVDGMEWDVPDTAANRAFFGSRAGPAGPAPFPKIRVVTITECGSHAAVAAAVGPAAGGKGSGEQALARKLYPGLEEGWLLLADRNFYSFTDWCTAAGTGAALLWRVRSNVPLPVLEPLGDGCWPRPGAARTCPKTRPATSGPSSTPSRTGTATASTSGSSWSPPLLISAPPRRPSWPGPTTSGGSTRPGTPSSRRTCAARDGCCARSPRPWPSRRSGATC